MRYAQVVEDPLDLFYVLGEIAIGVRLERPWSDEGRGDEPAHHQLIGDYGSGVIH